jgi:hypothetical protein
MSETQRPKPTAQEFEVPDLELDPAPRPAHPTGGSPAAHTAPRSYGAPDLFDEDSFEPSGLHIEPNKESGAGKINFGSTIAFDAPGDFELVSTAPPSATDSGPHSGVTRRASSEEALAWPSGRTPDAEALPVDPLEVSILGDYGSAPSNALLTPVYAYRVFVRRRELSARLAVLNRERDRAEAEREGVLAELGRELRPEAEHVTAFRRFFAPISELEAALSQRGQVLSALNAELGAESAKLDTELPRIAERVSAQQEIETAAARMRDERALSAQRTEAKLKRVQIEIRAVTHVAEQKLGPQGGQVPELEAAQLATLRQRAEAIQPELARAKDELTLAERALERARSELDALRQTERQTVRAKRALAERYEKELQAGSAGLSESETEQRKALAELGRAALAARGTVPIAATWLARVREVSERADKLSFQAETQRRAVRGYDHQRVTQGVRLACAALVLFVLLIVLKVAL